MEEFKELHQIEQSSGLSQQQPPSKYPPSKVSSVISSIGGFLYEVIKTTLIIVIVALIIRHFLVQPFLVEGESMEPNFHHGEYLLIEKVSPRISGYQRGDVVIFKYPRDPNLNFIKRIIGLPGEKIEIEQGEIKIYNNLYPEGIILVEKYLPSHTLTSPGKKISVALEDDQFFILGDNRENSSDSRDWGPLPKKMIIGKAWLTAFPINKFGFFHRPTYDFSVGLSFLPFKNQFLVFRFKI